MAHPLEAELNYPLGDALPATGRCTEVAPGVRWLRMPLPFALDHINLWLLRDRQDGREGWTVVDCGIDSPATRAAWEQVFSDELQGLPVLRVIVTHMHPDHIGLAHWLCERWSSAQQACRLWISATDWAVARIASELRQDSGGEAAADFFALHGLRDPDALAQIRGRSHYYVKLVPKLPTQYRRLMHGMLLDIGGQPWRCIAGHGHAPEHISLHCEAAGVLIGGDMMLPRISTNVSVYDSEPEADPLPLYLGSIAALRALSQSTLVLPSHGKPFIGLHARIRQLEQHHQERLSDLLAACKAQAMSAADALPLLFRRPLDLHQTTFAMGESVAHLHMLAGQGLVRPRRGEDGVMRFSAVA